MKIGAEIIFRKVAWFISVDVVAQAKYLLGKEAITAIDELIDGGRR